MSKSDTNRENQVILVMITDGKKMEFSSSKKVPVLLTGVTSKYVVDFHCLNCLHSYRTENTLKSIKM